METARSPDQADIDLLLVEDNLDDARFVERLIDEYQSRRSGSESEESLVISSLDHVDRLGEGIERVQTEPPDVILLDLMLPDSRGIETVERMVESTPGIPVVVLTGQNENEIGIEAIRRGAQDYLTKGTTTGELIVRTVRYAIERMHTQRAIVDRNHRLALLNQLVRQDIRNDVSMIVGLGDQLRTQVDSTEKETIESLLKAAEHAVDLTDTAAEVMDVLAATEVGREPCNLLPILETSIERLQHEHDVDLTFERRYLADTPLIVSASPMLESVFDHLLSNAVEHSPQTTPQVTVTIDATADRVTVEIADDGIGIADAQKALLVDPATHSDIRSGIGVGFYLVTTLLDVFDGTLEIADNHPRGTSITVSLRRVNNQ
ncbi:ATP-binding response regulator [Natronosalvus halobius]|uniref:ATP-binding response regulator n=1 Tax=Natronosalvus halobius TaxID=2953746 RepID=UPI0020A0B226|nr:hybrid sensor histidine kinase/response regulator [Natronosalvus halobius]USZ71489.1 hybrid sensor histidine kinase/response regulator [Natronosalvus halobius]